jgi:cysteinyl-tRNA synthetase
MAMRFDMVRRYLIYRRLDLFFLQNVTDIDDKIIQKVLETGVDPIEMTTRFADEFYDCLKQLRVLPVDRLTRVTEFVPQIIRFIEELIARGFAYATDEGNVYFDVAKKSDYGKLSNQKLSMLLEGVRKEGEPDKRNPVDFALWKRDSSTKLSQPSPWGIGRPGWHIECSSMIYEALGPRIDIHGGALDLKFPHHENEIAQSEAHSGEGFASIWMHCGLLNIDGQKMSKSLGNFIKLSDALERFGSIPLRFAVARHHYRSSLDLSEKLLRETLNSLLGFHRLFNRVSLDRDALSIEEIDDPQALQTIANFEAAMDNDFNSPEALVILDRALSSAAADLDAEPNDKPIPSAIKQRVYVIRQLGNILGVFFDDLELVATQGLALVARGLGVPALTPQAVTTLIGERNEARRVRDFARSDELRRELNARGVELLDTKAGSSWRFV